MALWLLFVDLEFYLFAEIYFVFRNVPKLLTPTSGKKNLLFLHHHPWSFERIGMLPSAGKQIFSLPILHIEDLGNFHSLLVIRNRNFEIPDYHATFSKNKCYKNRIVFEPILQLLLPLAITNLLGRIIRKNPILFCDVFCCICAYW